MALCIIKPTKTYLGKKIEAESAAFNRTFFTQMKNREQLYIWPFSHMVKRHPPPEKKGEGAFVSA